MQEKAEQWTESAKQTAQSACDKTADMAQSARDKAADVTQSARDKSADGSHSTKQSAQQNKEQAAGFLGQVYLHNYTILLCSFETKYKIC